MLPCCPSALASLTSFASFSPNSAALPGEVLACCATEDLEVALLQAPVTKPAPDSALQLSLYVQVDLTQRRVRRSTASCCGPSPLWKPCRCCHAIHNASPTPHFLCYQCLQACHSQPALHAWRGSSPFLCKLSCMHPLGAVKPG